MKLVGTTGASKLLFVVVLPGTKLVGVVYRGVSSLTGVEWKVLPGTALYT